MPRRKQQAQPPAAAASEETPPVGFTPQRFERELKDLASKAKSDTWGSRALGQISIYTRSIVLLGLLGVYSNVSQLALSPVYGTIPSSIWHSKALMLGCFVGWAGNLALRRALPVGTAQLLPLVAACVPVVQFLLDGFSRTLGTRFGPAVTEALTLVPLAVLTASSVADYLEGADFGGLPGAVADAGPGIVSWGSFKLMEHIAEKYLQIYVGRAFLCTRLGLEVLLAASYAVLAPSKYLVLAIPALIHTAAFNTHVFTPSATAALNATMMADGYMLLERRESVTGYISVVENFRDGVRFLRADHSLLGGDWVNFRGGTVTEPIFGVFAMLEAVRLVERKRPVADADASALVIGLGIGTTPSALVAHGIDTTVVEIDPAVHEFALKYFELKENNPAVIEDAVAYTSRLAASEPKRTYDYIVHDVFTGGAEPVDLFTLEFLENLSSLLKPDGVVAINYAGDLALPAPKIIVRTIQKVFPSCRMFRESPADPESAVAGQKGTDYTNMVVFCRKTKSPLTFRRPVEADFLRSRARQVFLEPEHEFLPRDFFASGADEEGVILRRNETDKVREWHKASAAGHWAIMRDSIPGPFWERW